MTNLLILEDSRLRPELFHWNGPIEQRDIATWLATHGLAGHCPEDLLALWRETGGGEIFESESLLGPFADPAMGDDVDGVNVKLKEQGLPLRYLVFHVGITTSAVDLETGRYVELVTADFNVERSFANLNDWYRDVIRQELGGRYGL